MRPLREEVVPFLPLKFFWIFVCLLSLMLTWPNGSEVKIVLMIGLGETKFKLDRDLREREREIIDRQRTKKHIISSN